MQCKKGKKNRQCAKNTGKVEDEKREQEVERFCLYFLLLSSYFKLLIPRG